MANERKTEKIIREIFVDLNKDDKHFVFEEQSSDNKRVSELLGRKQPDFIGSHKKDNNLVILVEAKASNKDHKKAEKQIKEYANLLKTRFTVVAIAASGSSKISFKTTTFTFENGIVINYKDHALQSFSWYKKLTNAGVRLTNKSLKSLAKHLNEFMFREMQLVENRRPLLISGILIALSEPGFRKSYKEYNTSDKLIKVLTDTINGVIHRSMPKDKVANLLTEFDFIKAHEMLRSGNRLLQLIEIVDDNVYDLLAEGCDHDIMGEFYSEFLSYVGGDQQALGIVLTPRHITELMVDLVNTNVNTVLLDTCAGTGGFLVSGMTKMLKLAKGNKKKEIEIKQKQLIGIELQSHMYALAVSNMLIRGDGKANMVLGSCFMPNQFKKVITNMSPTAGVLNPPFAQGGENTELHFADNMISMLTPNSLGAVILPMSCAIKYSEMKKKLLKKHTLEAVISMPEDLFYPVAVVTCIMIFRSHAPHKKGYETWFGYYKNDGFVKTRTEGRADVNKTWPTTKLKWLDSYYSKKVEAGESILKSVEPIDEWCAEAYMETSYSEINHSMFQQTIKNVAAFNIKSTSDENFDSSFETIKWKYFKYTDLFNVERGNINNIKNTMPGITPVISASGENNGVMRCVDMEPFYNTPILTIVAVGESTGKIFYHNYKCCVSSNVNVLLPKEPINKEVALFIATVAEAERYRYSYGRVLSISRLKDAAIKLPVTHNGKLDTEYMENYIKTLPFSSSI